MKFIRQQVLKGEPLFGCSCVLGSSLTVEMAGKAGFDWLWIDMEHGAGGEHTLICQLQAASAVDTAAVVRIAWNEAPRFKRVLDMGASGVIVPYVNTAEEAENAVRAMRYPPQGIRGIARFHRAAGFAQEFDSYFSAANHSLLTVVQVETQEAVKNVESIAAVEGVDVVFLGPMDLTTNMGISRQYDHPDYLEAVDIIRKACAKHDKAAGTFIPTPDSLEWYFEKGYTFLVAASDGGLMAAGMRQLISRCGDLKRR
jgi:4-hydroxy-2-oxoheptanedioate aldolase